MEATWPMGQHLAEGDWITIAILHCLQLGFVQGPRLEIALPLQGDCFFNCHLPSHMANFGLAWVMRLCGGGEIVVQQNATALLGPNINAM